VKANGTERPEGLARPVQEDPQGALFGELQEGWREHWWGMPEYVMGDARPMQQITVNFTTWSDVLAFAEALGINVSPRTDTIHYPPENLDAPSAWEYVDATAS